MDSPRIVAASAGQHTADPVFRHARFEEVPAILRVMERAIEHGCRAHYGPRQRRAVFLTYAQSLFVDVLDRFETVTAELDGRLAAVAQLDPAADRLRALFVDAGVQRRGVGRALLAHMMDRAAARGCARLQGAMSLNAVAFYTRAGFRPSAGRDRLSIAGVSVPVVPMAAGLPRPAGP